MNSLRRIDWRIDREPLFDVAATRRIEREAAASLAPHTLMSRAGAAIARLAIALVPHARHVVVHAGPGNNGGDGIEAATQLTASGKTTTVVLHGAPADLPDDAAHMLARARHAGLRIAPASSWAEGDALGADLVIDALLGIGASRAPDGPIAAAIAQIAACAARGSRVLAVDVPSGLDADRGQPHGDVCVTAHDTLSLLTLKPGLFTAEGRDLAGTIWLDPLGTALQTAPPNAWLVGVGDRAGAPAPRRHAEHKGSFGDVAVVGGAPGMTGAAMLAASAAHAAGAGRVFVDLLASVGAAPPFDAVRPELMFRDGWWQGPIAALQNTTVVCGCGGGELVRKALPRLLSAVPRLVLDADALNAIAADASLRSLLAARASRGHDTILTPHPLETARLLGRSVGEVQADRLSAAREIAERFAAVVVVKGSGSIVAAPDRAPCINSTGNAALASAGTGDVLAGWIGGRWRIGAAAFDVAMRSVVEHGAAAEPDRPGALRAGDLVEALYRRSRRTAEDPS